ncbi:MAG: inorganic phosphate transporter [Paludibacteraceae bacterium]
MSTIYLMMIVFLFSLAIMDLWVGVSNDAVNFLNSAIGSKVAPLRVIILIAAVGVFIGAATSNGMMDIARHGIFRPEQFTFEDIMCIFMAVMLTDVILLDIFNSIGLPTSTTVSLVFELLGGTFCLACFKIASDTTGTLEFSSLLNTGKALEVILGIFLSVGIAFVAGAIVQWLTRLLFTFNYTPRLKFFVGIFGGLSITAILYFVFVKILASSPVMPKEWNEWIGANTWALVGGVFVGSTLLMEMLYLVRVNVFRIIILFGTFALAMAFAGNDLVNFIGVPLAALSAYQDYAQSGCDAGNCMMGSLNAPASTSVVFLIGAGAIMVAALTISKKARNVVQTSVNLSRQAEGDEMFGGSRAAKSIVRGANRLGMCVEAIMPVSLRRWLDTRFNKEEVLLADGAAFDVIRASVNLVIAGVLIIMGTSLQLPLSTTYVTFIVAMGTSLADRAWTRESAVYRITGVLSVIGGWFLTAAIAFIVAGAVCLICYWGGVAAMIVLILVVVTVLIVSNIRSRKPTEEPFQPLEQCYQQIAVTQDSTAMWNLLQQYHKIASGMMLVQVRQLYLTTCAALEASDLKELRQTCRKLDNLQQWKRKTRARELMALRRITPALVLEKNTWFHLGSNAGEQMLYGLKRIAVPCRDHIDNGFYPLTEDLCRELQLVAQETAEYYEKAGLVYSQTEPDVRKLLAEIDEYKIRLSALRKKHLDRLTTHVGNELDGLPQQTALLYLNILQESRQLLSELRHFLRAYVHFTE